MSRTPMNTSGVRGSAREPSEYKEFRDKVLRRELELIAMRRAGAFSADENPPPPLPGAPTDPLAVNALGLAFSGGGIRSATFNLGIIQALAEQKLLPYVDYLSTVSGGGYIGSWLHGLIRSNGQAVLTDPVPKPADADPITFLRKYSNYLAPRRGLFKADSWVIAFIWLRNVLLNQLILMPAIAAFAAVALMAVFLKQVRGRPVMDPFGVGFNFLAGVIAVVVLCIAGVLMARRLRPIARQSLSATRLPAHERKGLHERGLPIVSLVFAAIVALGGAFFRADSGLVLLLLFGLCLLVTVVIQVGGGFVECYTRRRTPPGLRTRRLFLTALFHVFWMSVTTALLAAALVKGVWTLAEGWQSAEAAWKHVIFGPPLVSLSLIAAVMLLIGLMGVDYPDAAREWTARVGAMLGIVTAAWAVLFTLAVLGPWGVTGLLARVQTLGIGAIAAWLLTTAGGVLAGQSERTSGGSGTGAGGRALEFVTKVAPTVFLIGYIIAIAAGVHVLLERHVRPGPYGAALATAARQYEVTVATPEGANVEVTVKGEDPGWLERALQPAVAFSARYPSALVQQYSGPSRLLYLLLLFGVFLALAVIASARININEFSLHHFYKNRLVRAYLGASHARAGMRLPNALTGFDPLDDFPLSTLTPDPPPPAPGGEPRVPYFGPYPIVNVTLNLNSGAELAQQERKAASFVFTPAFSGFDPMTAREERRSADGTIRAKEGFRETVGYAESLGPSLGTTMAISGAAANPNSGFHTSGPMAFLLTVFNARLGWWLGNPRFPGPSAKPGPTFALKYLFAELLGQTTADTKFVNLSDGGHFDNLGLYELIRRRCRFIIACDSEEDGKLEFGSLGGAIRKCRADFGVEIEIDPQRIRLNDSGRSDVHCVVGRILYPQDEKGFDAGLIEEFDHPPKRTLHNSAGWLLYIKSSLSGDEPADVLEYRSRCRAFPHESTGDQFFSESQFESYRRLGLHIGRTVFHGTSKPHTLSADWTHTRRLVAIFQQLTRKWYAPIPVTSEAASRLADAYVEIMRGLVGTPELEKMFRELQGTRLDKKAVDPAVLAGGMALIQLMQNVYTEFKLEDPFNRANPKNAGWINVFREWATSDLLFKEIWPQIKRDYHPLFHDFMEWLTTKGPEARDVPPRW